MINIILQTAKASDIEKLNQNKREKDCIYIPKRVYASNYTIEEMLKIHKEDFDIQSFLPILKDYGITDVSVRVSSLSADRQLFIHTLSFLCIERKIIYIDIPPNDIDNDTRDIFFDMIFSYNHLHDEINLITDDEDIITRVTEYNGREKQEKYDLEVFKQKINWLRVARKFSGGIFIFLAQVFLAIIMITAAVFVDNILANDYVPYVSIPENMIILDNQIEACEFNEISFNIPYPTCSKDQRYTYENLSAIMADDNVEAIYFEDRERMDAIDEAMANEETVDISIPYFAESISPYFSRLYCNEDNPLVTCGDYNQSTSIIGVLTANSNEALVRNIAYSEENPSYLFVVSNDVDTTASMLAKMNPAVKVLTNDSINEYRTYSSRHFLIFLIVVGVSLSLAVVIIVFLQMRTMNLTFGGLRYFADHLTMNRKRVRAIYLGVQGFNFLYTVSFIYFVVSQITYYQVTLQIMTAFSAFNSILWLYFCSLPGREYYSEKNYVLSMTENEKPN